MRAGLYIALYLVYRNPMTMTTTTQSELELFVSATDQEEVAYGLIGYELECELGDGRMTVRGEHVELVRWAEEMWAPVAKASGWPAARFVSRKGKPVEY